VNGHGRKKPQRSAKSAHLCATSCGGGNGGGFWPGGSVDAWAAQVETTISGYSLYDAMRGEPGSYLTDDMYGNLGFGFSVNLWEETWKIIDSERTQTFTMSDDLLGTHSAKGALSFENGAPDTWVLVENLGFDTVVSGPVPDFLSALSDFSRANTNLGETFWLDFKVRYSLDKGDALKAMDEAWQLLQARDPLHYSQLFSSTQQAAVALYGASAALQSAIFGGP
jgi:hypothetical protein